jgi:hypothetical protein
MFELLKWDNNRETPSEMTSCKHPTSKQNGETKQKMTTAKKKSKHFYVVTR